jgi:hypothetical protein
LFQQRRTTPVVAPTLEVIVKEHQPDPAALVAATAEEIVAAIAPDADRLAALRRRFVLALHDTGWLDIVGRDWVRIGDDGLEFAPLSFKRADDLLRGIEDVGRDRRRQTTTCVGQLDLF